MTEWTKRKDRRKMLPAMLVLLCCCMISGTALAEDAGKGLSKTTGLPTDRPYRPYLVVISNAKEARPSWGLADADIVYETIYWGPSHTRYLALYNDVHPDTVGSVRGARVFGAELALGWDSVFVHYGGQDVKGTSIYDFFTEHDVPKEMRVDATRNSPEMRRMENRVNPHNAVFNMAAWNENHWPVDPKTDKPYEPRLPVLQFSDEPTLGETAAEHIAIDYGDVEYQPSYAYDKERQLYIRSYNGYPQTDMTEDGETRPITCANVIVQSNPLSYHEANNARPVLTTTGVGPMTAHIRGTAIHGYWTRENLDDPIQYYDEEDNVIVFAPGKTYVQVVPPLMYEGALHNQSEYTFTETQVQYQDPAKTP